MELIFIGRDFYDRSRTMMSSIYTVDGQRSDWGLVQDALASGLSVTIRPANEVEMLHYNAKLAQLLGKP